MPLLQVSSLTVREHGRQVIEGLSFAIGEHEQWAVTGPSGSGKTTLLHTLAGSHFHSGTIALGESGGGHSSKIVMVEQQHRFKNLSNTTSFYYQQRFNASDAEDAITVEADIRGSIHELGPEAVFPEEVMKTIDLLDLKKLLPVKLIQLSNGENKRLQIAKALLLKPSILLLDNPFIGLDAAARQTLNNLLNSISGKGVHIVLVTSAHEVPAFITHVLTLDKNFRYSVDTIEAFRQKHSAATTRQALITDKQLLEALTLSSAGDDFQYAVQLKNLNIIYNQRRILQDVSWQVHKGEWWSLSGPNGSGKSTLLSVICADNPQSYANEVYMFDRRRGTGESIWDIKRKIGFVSPELHLYFDTGINCFDVVASGLFDTIGLFRMLNDDQAALVGNWMALLGIKALDKKFLFQLSNSEQRLVLLARALVKNPPLLVLDEPCQGLDGDQVAMFRDLVNEICTHTGKTLIYVSHYPEELPACVNKFIRLKEGVGILE